MGVQIMQKYTLTHACDLHHQDDKFLADLPDQPPTFGELCKNPQSLASCAHTEAYQYADCKPAHRIERDLLSAIE
jgi:hypothetical protein